MGSKNPLISVCILVKNGEKTIQKTLDSIVSFPEVIVLDTGSTDKTLAIARQYSNVRIEQAPFTSFGVLRNELALMAKNDWIFALDSDEVVSPLLLEEIQGLSLDPAYAYEMRRENYYNEKRIRGCGWSPDKVARLYHRQRTQFSSDRVHESLETKERLLLKGPLFHTPYLSTSDFLKKMEHYSSLFAEQHRGKRKSSVTKAVGKALFTFFRSYLWKRGFLDGKEGFLISFYNANTAFYKYIKLAEKIGSCQK